MPRPTLMIVSVATALVMSACVVAQTPSPGADLAELQSRLQRLEDIEAIRDTGYCYGRAQDVVYRNYADTEKAKREGLAEPQQ